MIKTIFKEFVIIILILIIMLFLLGVILYNNVTINKIIPEIAKYETPAKIKDEISEDSNAGYQNEILTYEVTEADLKLYTQKNIYNAGKENPFMQDSAGNTGSSSTGSSSSQTPNINYNDLNTGTTKTSTK